MLDESWTQLGVIATVAGVGVSVIALYFQLRRRNIGTPVQEAGNNAAQQIVINSPNSINQNFSNTRELFAPGRRRDNNTFRNSRTAIPSTQEIIDHVLDNSFDLAPLVGKTLQIARSMGRAEESRWLERELYGYERIPDDQPTTFPEYRRVLGNVRIQMTGVTTSGPFDNQTNAERTIFVSFPVNQIESDVRNARRNRTDRLIFWLPIPQEWIPPRNLNATVTSDRQGHAPFIVEIRSLERLLHLLRLSIHRFVTTI